MSPRNPADDPRFARDVAKQIDRRRVKRRLTLWTFLLAVIAAAAGYLRCGHGLGLGGFGIGDGGDRDRGDQSEVHRVDGPVRCAIRISAEGFAVAGKVRSRDEAVAACKGASAVDVYRTGDARTGDPEELAAALKRAGFHDKDIAMHPVPPPTRATPEQPRGAPGEPPAK
jgi:hypothetical protein